MSPPTTATTIACLVLLAAPAGARAQNPPASGGSQAEQIARLQQEVRELRQMLIQAMQVEQQHYDLLLKLMRSGGNAAAVPAELPASPPGAAAAAARAAATRREAVSFPAPTAVTGAVEVQGAPAGQAVFVYVENVKGPAARGRSHQIHQKDKQFNPQVSVVPWGTAVYFPNGDGVSHNVFSHSKRNTFDLGVLKAGQRGSPVVLREPGLVEIHCDIHERMWAEILVVPNGHFVKVSPDGKYRLAGVPQGERVIAAWTAGSAPVRKTVQLGPDGGEASFQLTVSARRSHNNKSGQPYGSYGE